MKKKYKVLIVEDDPLFADELKSKINKLNYDVVGWAEEDEEAIELFSRFQPEILVLDIQLDGSKKNGYDLAEYFLGLNPGVGILFISQRSDNYIVSENSRFPMSEYLPKDVDRKSLLYRLNAVKHKIENPSSSGELLKNSRNNSHHSSRIILVPTGKEKFLHINPSELFYAEAQHSYANLYTSRGNFRIECNLTKLEEDINDPFIVKCHKAYLVNLLTCQTATKNSISYRFTDSKGRITVDKMIPFGRTYRKDIHKKLLYLT